MIELFIASVGAAIYILGTVLCTVLEEFELKVIVMSISIFTFLVSIITAAYVDYNKGKYVCKNCGNTFKPTFFKYLMSPHFGSTRHLECPCCNEKSWCKRSKDKD